LLYLSEIYSLALPRARLVVLSACETGLGQFYKGEGVVSLIHPFLAGRVSTVVASLWPVESQATSDLMIEFHRARRTGNQSAGNALRAAQLKMIEQIEAHPFYWASFVVVGGDY
jgi:CHAT domain-containing protein